MGRGDYQEGEATRARTKSSEPVVPSLEDPGREAECLTCRDGGWLRRNVPVGDPEFGKAIPCPNCVNWRHDEERKKNILKHSGIPEARRMCNLESFHYVSGADDACLAAYEMAEGRADFIWLLFYGGNGNGKTHLAYGIALAVADRGLTVAFRSVSKLFREMRLAINTENTSIDDVVEGVTRVDLLVLDDLGAEAGSDWEKAKLDEIIDARYVEKKMLVATTNTDPRQLPERIISRFKDKSMSRMVYNKAPDYRPKMVKE